MFRDAHSSLLVVADRMICCVVQLGGAVRRQFFEHVVGFSAYRRPAPCRDVLEMHAVYGNMSRQASRRTADRQASAP